MTIRPLDGVRVLELATWIAAPSAAALLADLGADVVKIEPPNGDPFRASGMIAPGGQAGTVFELDNRGKRSIVVDLEQAEGP
ncbi:MAG: CoA transferase, partial [Dehalococcoidia bacterium]